MRLQRTTTREEKTREREKEKEKEKERERETERGLRGQMAGGTRGLVIIE